MATVARTTRAASRSPPDEDRALGILIDRLPAGVTGYPAQELCLLPGMEGDDAHVPLVEDMLPSVTPIGHVAVALPLRRRNQFNSRIDRDRILR